MFAGAANGQATLYGVGSGLGDYTSELYRIDNPTTAPQAIILGDTGMLLYDLAIHPLTGEGYAIDVASGLHKVDLKDGSLTWIGSPGALYLNALEFLPCGRLLAWGQGTSYLYELDPATGAATVLFDTTFRFQ